ncbi:MAG: hypothetical protein M9883_21115 [Methylobacteriaceae bacterium]|nr:hypothetical protein [Methylobacteriaceae bacterium]
MKFPRLVASLGAALALAGSAAVAASSDGPAQIGILSNNQRALQTPEGLTLYVYDKDPIGKGISNCFDTCVNSWPPFRPASAQAARGKSGGDWTVIARDDGSKQWAYKGRPLYRFYRDDKPGASNGAFFEGGQWSIAHP